MINIEIRFFTIANILSLSYGAFLGWPSAIFLEDKGLPVSLVTTIMTISEMYALCFGGIVGTIFFSCLAHQNGPKTSLMFMTIPAVVIIK